MIKLWKYWNQIKNKKLHAKWSINYFPIWSGGISSTKYSGKPSEFSFVTNWILNEDTNSPK